MLREGRPAGRRPGAVRCARANARGGRATASSGCASRSASTRTCAPSCAASPRPADRTLDASPPVAAGRPPTRALRGARLGDLRAADRVRARGRDRAAHGGCAGAALDGTRWRAQPLRDLPPPRCWPAPRPALLQSFDLAGGRAITLVRAAREVARGRIDLHDPDHERGWRRLRAIPGIGPWTVEMLALNGQGRHDQVPAGDVGLLKLVGRCWAAAIRARAPRNGRYASSSPPMASGLGWRWDTCSPLRRAASSRVPLSSRLERARPLSGAAVRARRAARTSGRPCRAAARARPARRAAACSSTAGSPTRRA